MPAEASWLRARAFCSSLMPSGQARASLTASPWARAEPGSSPAEASVSSSRTAAARAERLKPTDSGDLSGMMGKEVFAEMFSAGKSAAQVVEEKGLKQVSDSGELEAVLQKIFDAHPEETAAFRGGTKKLMGIFVGQVMKGARGQANPKLVNELVQKMLG